MKKIILITLILSLGGILNAQYINSSGIPTNKKSESNFVQQQKSANEISSSTIVNAFPAHVNYGTDIAFDGQLIWIEGYAEYFIYGINPENGLVVDSIAIDIKRPYGLTFDGQYFWILDNENKLIEKINKSNGILEDIIYIDLEEDTYPTSLEIINGEIFYNDPRGEYPSATNDYTRQITKTGISVSSLQAKGNYPTGICFDGQYLWSTDNDLQEIHQIDLETFEIIKTIKAPGGIYPNGLTFDGEFLWVANNSSDSIYQIDVGMIQTNISQEISNNSFSIYPNIVKTSTTIDCSKYINKNISIELVNQSGQVVSNIFDGKLNIESINYSIDQKFPDGLYFCSIRTENDIKTEKLIIMK
jgi:hypothetical protein